MANLLKTKMFDLVNALNQIAREHQAWVRLHYVYPYPHVDDVLPLMAEFSEHGYGVLALLRYSVATCASRRV